MWSVLGAAATCAPFFGILTQGGPPTWRADAMNGARGLYGEPRPRSDRPASEGPEKCDPPLGGPKRRAKAAARPPGVWGPGKTRPATWRAEAPNGARGLCREGKRAERAPAV